MSSGDYGLVLMGRGYDIEHAIDCFTKHIPEGLHQDLLDITLPL